MSFSQIWAILKLDRSPGPGYKTETEVRSQDLGQANGQNMGTSDDPKTLAVVQNSPDAGPLVQFRATCNNDGRTKWSQMVGNSHSARDILWHPYGNGIHMAMASTSYSFFMLPSKSETACSQRVMR